MLIEGRWRGLLLVRGQQLGSRREEVLRTGEILVHRALDVALEHLQAQRKSARRLCGPRRLLVRKQALLELGEKLELDVVGDAVVVLLSAQAGRQQAGAGALGGAQSSLPEQHDVTLQRRLHHVVQRRSSAVPTAPYGAARDSCSLGGGGGSGAAAGPARRERERGCAHLSGSAPPPLERTRRSSRSGAAAATNHPPGRQLSQL